MTKIKNSKKGLAKKAVSISLTAAMLATSGVPAFAADFSDGAAAGFVTEAPADIVVPEAEAVEAAPADVPQEASTTVNADVNVNLTADKSNVVWSGAGGAASKFTVNVAGNLTDKNDSTVITGWKYRWLDENGIAVITETAPITSDNNVNNAITLKPGKELAGKTLTLYVSKTDAGTGTDFDINTGITVAVEKRALSTLTLNGALSYTGFAQSLTASNVSAVNDSENGSVTSDDYSVTSTSATNVDDSVTLTVTANSNSAYTGSASNSIKIGKKTYDDGDIVADTVAGQTYQFTGAGITIPTDKVTLKESLSVDGGEDDKLNGADLSAAVTGATTNGKTVGNWTVRVSFDATKLTNFDGTIPTYLKSTQSVAIVKRDLSTAGTKITVKDGKIKTGTKVSELASKLIFTGAEGTALTLDPSFDYTISVKDPSGAAVNTLGGTGYYNVTVTATSDGNCLNSQSFEVTTTANVLTGATFSASNKYKPSYTGSAITPSQSDLGDLTVNGTVGEEKLQSTKWEITGYTNNTNASVKKDKDNYESQAYVNIKILGGSYVGETYAMPFVIDPLNVTAETVTVPSAITYNKAYTQASQYAVPVAVVAKSADGKTSMTLNASDYTVAYSFDPANTNKINSKIVSKVTITNTNYIGGTSDYKTVTVEKTGEKATTIKAKALADSMVVVSPSSYVYTGGKIAPTYTVVDGALTLYKKGDVAENLAEYKEVSITDAVNVGTGKINISAEGLNDFYSGTATGTFTITAASTSDVKVTIDDQDYTGQQVRPRAFTATLNGNNVTDQFEIVSYGTNKEAGTGTVVLKPVDGNKNFTGSNITASFNIIQETVAGTLKIYDAKGIEIKTIDGKKFDYDGTAKTFAKEALTLTAPTKATADDFEIKYVDNVTGGASSDNGNKAYVYAVAKDGTGYAGTKKITTADGTVIKGVVDFVEFYITPVVFEQKNASATNGTYAGGLPVKPQILVQIGGKTLVEGTDYKVAYTPAASDAMMTEVTSGKIHSATITGINGYNGSSVNVDWGIDKKNLKDCDITVKNGDATVLNGYMPVAAAEYTVKDNGNGTYTITAATTSKNYTGSQTVVGSDQVALTTPVLAAVNVDRNHAKLAVATPSEGATGYDYIVSTSADPTNKAARIATKANKGLSTTAYYLEAGTYYAYTHAWVKVDGKKQFSDWSAAQKFTIVATTPSTPAITNVEVKKAANGTRTVTLTLDASTNAEGYDIYIGKAVKAATPAGDLTVAKTYKKMNQTKTTVTFTNLPATGTLYASAMAYNHTAGSSKVFSHWAHRRTVKALN